MGSTLISSRLLRWRPPQNIAPSLSPPRLLHLWTQIKQPGPSGLTELLDYRKAELLAPLSLRKQKLHLWRYGEDLGVTSMQYALTHLLGRGKMLSLRTLRSEPEPECMAKLHNNPADPSVSPAAILHYDILDFSRDVTPPNTILPGLNEIHLRPDMNSVSLRHHLCQAYHALRHYASSKQYPVEFHILHPRPTSLSSSKKVDSERGLEWVVNNRLDLHPEVILRAMPWGSLNATHPRINSEQSDVTWLMAAHKFSVGKQRKVGKKLEKNLEWRARSLRELIDQGDLTEDGRVVSGKWLAAEQENQRHAQSWIENALADLRPGMEVRALHVAESVQRKLAAGLRAVSTAWLVTEVEQSLPTMTNYVRPKSGRPGVYVRVRGTG